MVECAWNIKIIRGLGNVMYFYDINQSSAASPDENTHCALDKNVERYRHSLCNRIYCEYKIKIHKYAIINAMSNIDIN